METTIQVKQTKPNGKWYNITDEDGKTYGIDTEKNPKTKEAIDAAQDTPFPLTGEIFQGKNGNWYIADKKEKNQGGGYKKQNEELILWEACLKASCMLHAEKGGSVTADINKTVLASTTVFFNEGSKYLK